MTNSKPKPQETGSKPPSDWRRDETPGENLGTQGDSDDVADSPERGLKRPGPAKGDSDDQGDDSA